MVSNCLDREIYIGNSSKTMYEKHRLQKKSNPRPCSLHIAEIQYLFLEGGLIKTTVDRLHHDTGDLIGISIGSWSSILEVTIALVTALSWNTDGATTIGDAIGE